MSADDLAALHEFLRQNGQRFSSVALRESLLAQGYDAATIDLAMAANLAEPRSPLQRAFRRGWWIALGNLLATLIVIGPIACIAELLVGIYLVTGRRRQNSEQAIWGAALLFGALVYAAVGLLIFGSCLGGLGMSAAEANQKPLILLGLLGLFLLVGGLAALARWAVRHTFPSPPDAANTAPLSTLPRPPAAVPAPLEPPPDPPPPDAR